MKKIIALLFCKILICSEDVKAPVDDKIWSEKPGLVVSLSWTSNLVTSGEHASDSLRKIEAAIEASKQEFLKRAARKAAKKAQEEVIELSSMPQSPTVLDQQRPDSTRSQALTPSPTPSPSNFRDRGCFGFPREDN